MQIIFDLDEYSDLEDLLACREWLAHETAEDGEPADVSLDQVMRMLVRNWRKTADNWTMLHESNVDDTASEQNQPCHQN